MTLKHPHITPHGGWTFYFTAPNGTEVQVTGANGLDQLTEKARGFLRNAGMPIPDDLRAEIEHQICLRQPMPEQSCWGRASALHRTVKKAAAAVAGVAEKMGAKRVARAITRIGGCQGCGGKRTFSGKSGLGRAGRMDRMMK